MADEEGEAIVIAGTDDVFRGPNQPRLRQVTAFQLPEGTSTRCMASALFAHPEPDRGGLLFGIERAPDGTYWMSNYNRGVLYQLDPTTGQVLRRVGLGQQKLGLGIAILLHCELHNGDVNLDGCVDDADLLSVLFHVWKHRALHPRGYQLRRHRRRRRPAHRAVQLRQWVLTLDRVCLLKGGKPSH